MPVFEIEDSESGIKILAEGDSEPDQKAALELVDEEVKFLKENLYQAPGNKFVLDVGPLFSQRALVDKASSIYKAIDESSNNTTDVIKASNEAKDILFKKIDRGESFSQKAYDFEFTNALKRIQTERGKSSSSSLNPTQETLNKLPENSFMLISHGGERGGLSTEQGTKFTLNNIAKILGSQSNNVHNVVNLACYGGKQCRADYQSAFPNATNIVATSPDTPNTISIDNIRAGRWFSSPSNTGMEAVVMEKSGDTWKPMTSSSVFTNVTAKKKVD